MTDGAVDLRAAGQIEAVFAGRGRDLDAGHGSARRHDVRLMRQLTTDRARLHDARPTHDERYAVARPGTQEHFVYPLEADILRLQAGDEEAVPNPNGSH